MWGREEESEERSSIFNGYSRFFSISNKTTSLKEEISMTKL